MGDRNVAQRMREVGSNLGGESSGHIIFTDFATTGDGLLAVVKLIDLIRAAGVPLSELRKQVVLFPQQTLNLHVARKLPIGELKRLSAAMTVATEEFADDGRVLVRYSGTEPKLRLLVEGANEQLIAKHLQALESAARADLQIIDS